MDVTFGNATYGTHSSSPFTKAMFLYSIQNVNHWKEMQKGKLSELDNFVCIYPIFQALCRNISNIIIRTGEVASAASKEARSIIQKKYNVDLGSAVHGRKIDLVFSYEGGGIDLTSVEWKKGSASDRVMLLQQTKNTRINKCNLVKLRDLLSGAEMEDLFVVGADFKGFSGQLYSMELIDGVFVANPIGKVTFPKHPKTVRDFSESLVLLLEWRDHLRSLSDLVDTAVARKIDEESYGGISDSRRQIISETDFTFFSPKRKRTKKMTNTGSEEEDSDTGSD
ncbi:hypothetical protein BJV82DRAFT_601630 [Fennellomyces sp. T-0311]|nr:hypothetical protein BJV82DRAFT_601630 [Fennellomyces sp. T-0311]